MSIIKPCNCFFWCDREYWTWRPRLIARCLNSCTILCCFMYCYAATNRSTFEIKKYSDTNIWEASNLTNNNSVYFCEYPRHFSCAVTENFTLFFRIFTLYSKSLPLDLACRVWDVFCRDGEEFLFRTALGILKLFEDILTKMDFIHIAQFLTKLPEDLPSEEFFTSIAAIQMQSRNKKWAQVKSMLISDNRWLYCTHEKGLWQHLEECFSRASVWFYR